MGIKTIYASGVIAMMAIAFSWPAAAQLQTINDDVLINGDDSTVNLKVTGTNGAIFTGTLGSGSIPATGAGTRMMWYPKKAAFRVGRAWDTEWDDAYIGDYSFATSAAEASGYSSVALLSGQASGYASFAVAGFAQGTESIAIRGDANGWTSVAIGQGYADGDLSVALGYFTRAQAYASVSLGTFNRVDSADDPQYWVATDSLLIVGNGESEAESNALVMRKNANMRTGGLIEAKEGMRTKPLGDLSMGVFDGGSNPATLDAGLKYAGE